MARFYDAIGFSEGVVETSPGVWEDVIVERKYFGNVLRNGTNPSFGDKVAPDISLGNSIDIMANNYAFDNLRGMRYIKFSGELWKVESVEVHRPRLTIGMGGVYDGPTAPTPSDP